MFGLALKFLNKEEEASDMVSEVFIKLVEELNKKDMEDEVVFRWLYRVTVNRCINFLKQNKRHCELLTKHQSFLEEQYDSLAESQELQSSELYTFLTGQSSKELQKMVVYQIALGMTINEIAEMMQLDRKTVSKKLKKFYEKSRTKLGHLWRENSYETLIITLFLGQNLF